MTWCNLVSFFFFLGDIYSRLVSGGQESVFNRTGTVSYPMSFPTSQMNGRSPAMAAGFPYSSYGQAYPHPPHSGAPSGFSPYNPPGSGGVIGGFHPSTSYAYGTTYAPSYTTTQAAASYLNAAAANHQALDGSRGPSGAGGSAGGGAGGSAGPKDERNSDPAAFGGYWDDTHFALLQGTLPPKSSLTN